MQVAEDFSGNPSGGALSIVVTSPGLYCRNGAAATGMSFRHLVLHIPGPRFVCCAGASSAPAGAPRFVSRPICDICPYHTYSHDSTSILRHIFVIHTIQFCQELLVSPRFSCLKGQHYIHICAQLQIYRSERDRIYRNTLLSH